MKIYTGVTILQIHNSTAPPRWSSSRRSSLLTREIGFKPTVGQINTSCHRLATDAALHCLPWRKLRRWAPPTRDSLTGTTSSIIKI